ncbi:hypothetical protein BH09PSE1_BH09PSE1_04560 [soil metagenome]
MSVTKTATSKADAEKDRLKTRHIDLILGRRLRDHREAMGLGREAVAEALDVSVTRIQNYEDGHRISAARLWQFCRRYGIEVETLFDSLPHHVGGRVSELAEDEAGFDNPLADDLVRAIGAAAADLNPVERRLALAALRGMGVRKFKRP